VQVVGIDWRGLYPDAHLPPTRFGYRAVLNAEHICRLADGVRDEGLHGCHLRLLLTIRRRIGAVDGLSG
jgi:hypothetical protein